MTVSWSQLGSPTAPGPVGVPGVGVVHVAADDIQRASRLGGDVSFDLVDVVGLAQQARSYRLGHIVGEPSAPPRIWMRPAPPEGTIVWPQGLDSITTSVVTASRLDPAIENLRLQLADRAEPPKLQHGIQDLLAREEQGRDALKRFGNMVRTEAHGLLKSDASFRGQFEHTAPEGFVMSADIRRSTDLMLWARAPERFAGFVADLCDRLIDIVKKRFGLFMGFTGDGILGFFPTFYSGPDSGYYAATAALECQRAFGPALENHSDGFSALPADSGLAIGLDFGTPSMCSIVLATVLVGPPVVFACRLADSGPAGPTLVNHGAYVHLSRRYSGQLAFSRTAVQVKHQGGLVAYELSATEDAYEPETPSWFEDQ